MYQIYCDGASRSNPGEASIGVSINKNNTEIDTIKKKIGINTNNVAEYLGLVAALEYCVENSISNVNIFLDSLLVCLLYTSPSPRDAIPSRMPSSA